jgi:biotin carboxyl carrier protein
MERYTVTVGSRTFEIHVSEVAHDEFRVRVEGQEFDVRLEDLPSSQNDSTHSIAPSHAPAPAATASGSLVVTTPMPGTVTAVLVRPGDTVGRGDVLLQLEAMKMTNAVRAPHAAVVAEVIVVEGQHVAYGTPLLRLAER